MAVVGLRIFDLHIPGAQSLKEKRYVLRSVKDRLGNGRYNISIAEVGHLDKWQRTELAIATVSGQRKSVERTLDAVRERLDREVGVSIIDTHTEIF
ncbi:MAG: DUF503 domain-containing protein [Gemmatimonadota bacterium]